MALSLAVVGLLGVLATLVLTSLRTAARLRRSCARGPTGDDRTSSHEGSTGLARRNRGPVATLAALTLFETVLSLAAPWPLKVVVDNAVGPLRLPVMLSALQGLGRVQLAVVMGVAGIALMLATAVVGYSAAVVSAGIAESVGIGLRATVMRRLLHLPLAFHDHRHHGDLANRLTGDVANVQDSMLARVEVLAPQIVAVGGMTVLMALLSPLLAAIVLAALPAVALVGVVRRAAVESVQRVRRAAVGDMSAAASELIANVRAVQAFGQQDRECRRFDRLSRETAVAGLRSATVSARFSPVADVVLALDLAVVLVVGTAQVTAHRLSLGALFVFLAYLAGLEGPVGSLSRVASTLGRGAASKERIAEILEHPEGEPRRQETVPQRPGAPELVVDGLGYAYDPGRPVLESVSFRVPAGALAVVVGPSGVGKSTLLALLMRLHDPHAGRLELDGVPLAALSHEDLHAQVALVPQDPWLFSGTIEENIAYGIEGASAAEIARAARLAHVDEFADRFADGLRTRLGEGGTGLSGGQRRRVALARALATGARLVLLDEPTAGLDPVAAREVVGTIAELASERTVLVATHDPALMVLATEVVALRLPSAARKRTPDTTPQNVIEATAITTGAVNSAATGVRN